VTLLPTALWVLEGFIGKVSWVKTYLGWSGTRPDLRGETPRLPWCSKGFRSRQLSFLLAPVSATLGPGCSTGGAPSALIGLGWCNILALLSHSFTLFRLTPDLTPNFFVVYWPTPGWECILDLALSGGGACTSVRGLRWSFLNVGIT
jgi:hypothetical protein